MAGLGKIVVATEELEEASRNVYSKANEYKDEYNKLYNLVNDLQNSWAGTDNIAYTNQIKEFQNDFNIMKDLMDDYAKFLSETASKYKATQEEIAAKAKTLSTGV